jgi:hypothetical protein
MLPYGTKNMLGKSTSTHIHQLQIQRKQTTGQKNNNQCHKIPNQSRNQVPLQEKTTSQPATIPIPA